MTRDEIITLLQIVHAYDNRRIDELLIRTWAEAARRRRWTTDAAVEAVHEHYSKSTAWMMPAHVTEAIRAARRQPAPAAEALALEAPVASEEQRAEFMAKIRALADKKAI